MTGALPTKIKMENAKVYVHKKDQYARVIHIDIEHPDINKIIKKNESTFCAGKHGGCFIGLKKKMIERAKKFVRKKRQSL